MALFPSRRAAQDRQLAHALRSVPLFREVPAEELVAIWRCLRERRVPAGTLLCRRGEPGDELYIIQSGTVELRVGGERSRGVVRRYGAGDVIGEMAVLTGQPRSADVVVGEDAVVWVLARAEVEDLFAGSVPLLRALNRALCERLTFLTQVVDAAGLAADDPEGLRFGPYRVVAQIGAGGMAAVYSAVHVATNAAVAVKVLPAAWGAAPELQERLRREAVLLQRIDHPNVIRVRDVGAVEVRLGGGCYLALEWLPHALDRVLRARYPEPLEVPRALALAHGIADGLAALHAVGVVHRDVKPSNVLLRADGTPVLTDLGLALLRAEAAQQGRLTATNVIVGTADYLAPEQVVGAIVDVRSDLYALGVVLYEMLAGVVPFAGRTPLEALQAQVEEEPPPLPARVPAAARAVVMRALQKRPEDRFPSAAAFAAALSV